MRLRLWVHSGIPTFFPLLVLPFVVSSQWLSYKNAYTSCIVILVSCIFMFFLYCTEPGKSPWMIFELMPYGDLTEVLRSNSRHFKNLASSSLPRLTKVICLALFFPTCLHTMNIFLIHNCFKMFYYCISVFFINIVILFYKAIMFILITGTTIVFYEVTLYFIHGRIV